jgi:serine/threonine-protein kinase
MPQAQQLGRYHLLDRIAFGGMAEIFRAKTFDSRGQVHLVAVKRVLAHLVEDQDFLQMLVDEAKISALLRHENIARLYEFARAGDEYFLAMEYVDGKDLRSLLERGRQTTRPIPPEHVAWVAMETAHALHAAHVQRDGAGRALRIVHRDVSPSNVLCSYHGEVKLCDFGIAKATLTRVQTKTGVIKGKVKYMSPEQAMGRKLDHRSDLFSLGTVMYEMLTLQPPFVAPTEIELIFAVRDARKVPIKEAVPDCPDELVRIVDKAMTRSRAARYQSGEDLALDLRIFLDKHQPGYRRSSFSRYMRKVFEDDIERELRQLEAYEIAQAESSQVGVNLIADALEPDAPFTKFTPMAASPTNLTRLGTSNFPLIEMPQPTDLHAQPTMMLDRASLGLANTEQAPETTPREDFAPSDSAVATEVMGPAPADIHAEATRILQQAPAPPLPSLHDAPTGERSFSTVDGYRPVQQAGPGDSHLGLQKLFPPREVDTGAVTAFDPSSVAPEDNSRDLHAQATMILWNPMLDGAAFGREANPPTPTEPKPAAEPAPPAPSEEPTPPPAALVADAADFAPAETAAPTQPHPKVGPVEPSESRIEPDEEAVPGDVSERERTSVSLDDEDIEPV